MPRPRRGRRNNQSLASKAYTLAKKAYRAPELKFAPITITTTPTSTGFINILSSITQGDSNNERIGDTILAKSLHYKATLLLNASATASLVRVIFFKWRSEAPAGVTDVLLTAAITSFKSQDLRFQSKILSDRVYKLNDASQPEIFFKGKIMLKDLLISFPEASATSNMNGIHMLILSDEATNSPVFRMQTRLYYVDS